MTTHAALNTAVDALLAQPKGTGFTRALVLLRDGEVVAEGYGPETDADTTLISWSMAKSVTHALFGLLTLDGLVDVAAAAPVPEWREDARSQITMQQLLNMRSGLRFIEDYVDAGTSDCITMLFGDGKADVAAYAASLPLEHEPGTFFNYSSGTTNILCRIAGSIVGGGEEGMRTYLRDRLFAPLGMASAKPRFDGAGTFIGSSFLYATARDFAKFGELYRNDGFVGSEQILPAGWVEHATTATPTPDTERHGYGAHWWLWPELGAYGAHGYEGQRVIVVPSKGLTLVRLGVTGADDVPLLEEHLRAIVDAA